MGDPNCEIDVYQGVGAGECRGVIRRYGVVGRGCGGVGSGERGEIGWKRVSVKVSIIRKYRGIRIESVGVFLVFLPKTTDRKDQSLFENRRQQFCFIFFLFTIQITSKSDNVFFCYFSYIVFFLSILFFVGKSFFFFSLFSLLVLPRKSKFQKSYRWEVQLTFLTHYLAFLLLQGFMDMLKEVQK